MCPYLGSGNPLYAGFYECDLTRTPTLCGGMVEHCQSPQAREKQEREFIPLLEAEPEGADVCRHGFGFDENCEWCDDEPEPTFSEYIHNGVVMGDLES